MAGVFHRQEAPDYLTLYVALALDSLCPFGVFLFFFGFYRFEIFLLLRPSIFNS